MDQALHTWYMVPATFEGLVSVTNYNVTLNEGGAAQWAKSEGEAVLLQFSGFTKDPMHDFNRLFC